MTLNTTWILQTAILLGIGALGYFLKEMKESFEKEAGENACEISKVEKKTDKEIKALEQKFNDYREDAASKYVHKDEFIRAVTNLDKKLDKIYDIVALGRKEM